MRVLLGLQPLTTTAYSLRVLPTTERFAGMARSYKNARAYPTVISSR
jgi:hypothetical protein